MQFLTVPIPQLMVSMAITDMSFGSQQSHCTIRHTQGDLTKTPILEQLLLGWYVQPFITNTGSLMIVLCFQKLNGHLSTFHGQVKRSATSKVEGFYQLLEGQGCVQKIKALILGSTYIYPTKEVSVSLHSYQLGPLH